MSDKNETKYVSILDNDKTENKDISNKKEDQHFNINDFYTILKNVIKQKINYEKLVK